ncbi:hypothetical protein ACFQX6_36890 [Streptosporangium lutulentum]
MVEQELRHLRMDGVRLVTVTDPAPQGAAVRIGPDLRAEPAGLLQGPGDGPCRAATGTGPAWESSPAAAWS